jgi:hypothetical protein
VVPQAHRRAGIIALLPAKQNRRIIEGRTGNGAAFFHFSKHRHSGVSQNPTPYKVVKNGTGANACIRAYAGMSAILITPQSQ